jgi:hypothetical protein
MTKILNIRRDYKLCKIYFFILFCLTEHSADAGNVSRN